MANNAGNAITRAMSQRLTDAGARVRDCTTSNRILRARECASASAHLRWKTRATVQTAGHECVRVRAVLRSGARLWPHWLPFGADEYEFHVQPERGVMLAVIARFGGEVFETSVVTQVTF